MYRPRIGLVLPLLLLLASLVPGLPPTGHAEGHPSDSPEGELRLPGPIVFQGSDQGPVTFDHLNHVALVENDCRACHIGLFKILEPSHHTSHQEMEAGRSCGGCHNGERASDLEDPDNCATCHVPTQAHEAFSENIPSRVLPIPQGEVSPGPVTFKHSSHQGPGMSCSRCHPDLFAREAGSTNWDKQIMLEGGSCGTCHDGKTAFGVSDDDQCQRCHVEERQP